MRKRYLVTFWKKIADDNGHERDIPQHKVEVFAPSREDAFQQGQADFCRRHGLLDWSHHADRYQIDEPDFPS